MAIIRAQEIRSLDDNSVIQRLSQVEEELLRERGQVATGGRTSNPGRIRELRRTRARLITIMHERALGLQKEARQRTPSKKEEGKKQEAGKKEEAKKEIPIQKEGIKDEAKKEAKTEGTKVQNQKPAENPAQKE